jgi:hypothetical protein
LVERGMLVLGAASNPWEMLSSLQPLQTANASAPAANIGSGQFLTDGATPAAISGSQPALPTGTIGQASLSPDVLGFLIWNQSQQPSGTPTATNGTNPAGTDGASGSATSGATGGSDPSGITSWPSLLSWFPPLSAGAAGNIGTLVPNSTAGAAATATSQPNTNADSVLAAGQPGTTPESSGAHGHHHHHGGFAAQSQTGSSDPLANLFGASAQDASSTTATNTDGSTTTTITYADGSEVTLTTPAQAASGANAGPTAAAAQPSVNSSNFLETLIQLQARLLSPSVAA